MACNNTAVKKITVLHRGKKGLIIWEQTVLVERKTVDRVGKDRKMVVVGDVQFPLANKTLHIF